jgi:hypothetical protein
VRRAFFIVGNSGNVRRRGRFQEMQMERQVVAGGIGHVAAMQSEK